ncbi:MAG: hypothetical protein RR619_01115, partial [Raoultibacter sp.]
SSDIGKYKTSPHALGIYFAFPFVDTKKALNATDDANAFALGPARFSGTWANLTQIAIIITFSCLLSLGTDERSDHNGREEFIV